MHNFGFWRRIQARPVAVSLRNLWRVRQWSLCRCENFRSWKYYPALCSLIRQFNIARAKCAFYADDIGQTDVYRC